MRVHKMVVAFVTCVMAAIGQESRISPHETIAVTLAGKQIVLAYGRPSIRDRKIMGGLVPYGQVWRTGADEATMLTTPVPMNIGGTEIPAGKYTLWTLPSAERWKLIVNKQTGQWGTDYDGGQDFARIDMQTSKLDHAVNKFTISWKKNGDRAADLVLEWENTRVSVPVRAQ